MRLKLRANIETDEKLSYVSGDAPPGNLLDCSAGYNPYGAPPAAVAALRAVDPSTLYDYPHGDILQQALLAHWSPYAPIGPGNLLLTDGSIGGLYLVNSAFAAPGAQLLSPAPQFPDYLGHALFMGFQYRPFYLHGGHAQPYFRHGDFAYRLDCDALCAEMQSTDSLLYLDNPNNPTGQAVPLDGLRKLLARGQELGVCVLCDEAYGEYIPEAESAATLIGEYENLIVLRTFSKGYGLAGLRVGYLLAAEGLVSSLSKLTNPYNAAQPSRVAAAAALSDPAFLEHCRASFARMKQRLRAFMKGGLHMAHTADTCPICMLYHDDAGLDLAAAFRAQGVLTYSGADFDGVGKNAVRLRIPHKDDFLAVQMAAVAIAGGNYKIP